MSRYRAHVIDDAEGWARNTVRLLLLEDIGSDQVSVLMQDDSWQAVAAGTVIPPNAGVVLPRAAIEAVISAFETWQGRTSHAETEARVLREWLAVERARVDASLGRSA